MYFYDTQIGRQFEVNVFLKGKSQKETGIKSTTYCNTTTIPTGLLQYHNVLLIASMLIHSAMTNRAGVIVHLTTTTIYEGTSLSGTTIGL